jgi:beta-N-acetylhexosaminidase
MHMPLGPVMLDLTGPDLTADDRRRLLHPMTGGVILFTRNYRDPEQIAALCAEIHALRSPHLLIAVDHEGGRVQRFREGFTVPPPMRELGRIWDEHPMQARHLAQDIGFVLGAELRPRGVDFSFAPVLDLDFGESAVIGDRAFHRHPQAVTELAHALMKGLHEAGMQAVGKHFPGHGFVVADSHVDVPVDERQYAEIEQADLIPFRRMIEYGLPAIMPAHVIYPKVDAAPAGFSLVWLHEILRGRLKFEGVIFSDDLSMEGARVAGSAVERGQAAIAADCDMVLVCGRPDSADMLLEGLRDPLSAVSLARLARMHGRPHPPGMLALHESGRYVDALHRIAGLGETSADLALNDPTRAHGNA